MLLAVNIPEQDPQPGQAESSQRASSASLMMPAWNLPTASKTELRSMSDPSLRPASMGPPDAMTEGMFSLAAAIIMPGTILSQFVTSARPSSRCASAIDSIESAMSSREAREYFIPAWPIAMPSQMPMEGNSIGVPPALLMPAFTASAIVSRWIWPGIISFFALTTPTRGLSSSSSV